MGKFIETAVYILYPSLYGKGEYPAKLVDLPNPPGVNKNKHYLRPRTGISRAVRGGGVAVYVSSVLPTVNISPVLFSFLELGLGGRRLGFIR